METTDFKTMQENLSQIEAKEIIYFKWRCDEPFTVVATDGKPCGKRVTLGRTYDLTGLDQLGVQVKHV